MRSHAFPLSPPYLLNRKYYRVTEDGEWLQYFKDEEYKIKATGHTLGEGGNLTKCGNEELIKACPATCTEYGWAFYYLCSECGNGYSDPEGKVKAFDKKTTDTTDENGSPKTVYAQPNDAPAGFKVLSVTYTADGTDGQDGDGQDTTTDTETNARPNETEQKLQYVEDKGLVVKPLGHLTETKPGSTDDDPEFFYHPTRDGHYLLCRRDCCYNETTKEYKRVSGLLPGEETVDEEEPEQKSDFGTLEKHTFEEGSNVCSKCGWGKEDESKKNKTVIEEYIAWGQQKSTVWGHTSDKNWKETEGIVSDLEDGEIIIANYDNGYGGYDTFTTYNNNHPLVSNILDLTGKLTLNGAEVRIVGLGNKAFKGRTNVETLIIPWTVRYIGEYAFDGCTGLKNVIFEEAPEGHVEEAQLYIANDAFESCSNLKSVVFPSHLRGVACSNTNSHAFYGTQVMEVTFNSVIVCIADYQSGDVTITEVESGAINCLNPLGTIYACMPQDPSVTAEEQWNKQTEIGNPNADMKAYLLGAIDNTSIQVTQEEVPAPAAISPAPDADGKTYVTKYDADAVKWIVKQYWDGAWHDVKE